MYRAAAAIIVFAGEALAHPGQGAPEAHLHDSGWGHILWVFAIVAVIVWVALRAK